MPAPGRTSLGEIVDSGRELLESQGLEGLTMEKVARAVGVRAPSLYKHVSNRGELIKLIIEAALRDLSRVLSEVVTGEDPRHDLRALALAFRSFAHQRPGSYGLIFAPLPEEWRPAPEVFETAVEPVFRTTSALVGPDQALEAARLVAAWAHGFMSMELAGAFRMGGDLDDAFNFGVERLGEALSRPGDGC